MVCHGERVALTAKQELFVLYYLRYACASKAAAATGTPVKSCRSMGCQWMKLPEVAAAIAEGRKRLREHSLATAERVMQEAAAIAFYDATKVVQHRRVACRCCWKNETPQDMADLWGPSLSDEPEEPNGPVRDVQSMPVEPDPECPWCRGAGVGRVHIVDTRDLSDEERAPIEGISEGREGISVKMASKVAALTLVARLLGMLDKDEDKAQGPPVNLIINGVQLAPVTEKKK